MSFPASPGGLPRRRLETGGTTDAADDPARRHAQGLLRAGERRRPPRLERARPVLRGLADLPRGARPVSGSIYAAAASEWHGAGVWRSADLGETWELSSEGLELRRGQRAEALEDLGPDGGARARCSPAARAAACSRAATARDLVAAQHARRPARPRRLERSRPTSRPAISACPAILAAPRRGRPASGP